MYNNKQIIPFTYSISSLQYKDDDSDISDLEVLSNAVTDYLIPGLNTLLQSPDEVYQQSETLSQALQQTNNAYYKFTTV